MFQEQVPIRPCHIARLHGPLSSFCLQNKMAQISRWPDSCSDGHRRYGVDRIYIVQDTSDNVVFRVKV
jgi:hypothetical protein